jgi:hypothetical protein
MGKCPLPISTTNTNTKPDSSASNINPIQNLAQAYIQPINITTTATTVPFVKKSVKL